MAILKILHYPDPRLRQRGQEVTTFDDALRALVADMYETMYDAPGVGLAANQVGDPRRFAVMDPSEDKSNPFVMVNPEILESFDKIQMDEGCLSVPGYFEKVDRYERIRYTALDEHGERFEREVDGLEAQAVQHELDHLDGKLFIDYLSGLKRNRIKKKLEKAAKAA